jgi:dihydroflavonol-4-reductase
MQTVLVTGSTGFIGSQICQALLEAGYHVRALHRSTSSMRLLEGLDVESAIGDITQPETLVEAMQGVDAVIHTAAQVDYWRDSSRMYKVTVEGAGNVFQAALDAGVQRVVHTSSVSALGVPETSGKQPQTPLLNENHIWNYRHKWWRYGHAKHLSEKEAQRFVALGLDVVIVNPTSIFGPGDANRISGEFVFQIARGMLPVAVPGGLNVVHSADVAEGHLAALERGRTGERYILGGENITHARFFRMIAEVVGVRPPQLVLPTWLLRAAAAPVDITRTFINLPLNGDLLRFTGRYFFYDTRKAQEELGLTNPRSTQQAIQDTYDWYKSHGYLQ